MVCLVWATPVFSKNEAQHLSFVCLHTLTMTTSMHHMTVSGKHCIPRLLDQCGPEADIKFDQQLHVQNITQNIDTCLLRKLNLAIVISMLWLLAVVVCCFMCVFDFVVCPCSFQRDSWFGPRGLVFLHLLLPGGVILHIVIFSWKSGHVYVHTTLNFKIEIFCCSSLV